MCRSRYRPIYRPICRPTNLDRHIGRESVNMSTDISVKHRSICQPTVDRYVSRDVDRHIGRGVHKLHMIPKLSRISSLNLKFAKLSSGKKIREPCLATWNILIFGRKVICIKVFLFVILYIIFVVVITF